MKHLPWSDMTREQKSAAIAAGVGEKLSAAEIGDRHEASRNAIIGHSHRYGPKLTAPRVATEDAKTMRSLRHYRTYVPKRRKPAVPRPARPPRERPKPWAPRISPQPRVQALPRVPAVTRQPEPASGPVRFAERRNWQCAFPVSGEPGPLMLVCGCRIARGSYCGMHWDRSRGKGTPSERSAPRELARAE